MCDSSADDLVQTDARSSPKQHSPSSADSEGLTNDCQPSKSIIIFHRLPVELIVEIFASAGVHCPGLRASIRTLRLSHVCRYWREVTLQSPQLWIRIEIWPRRKPEYQRMIVERSKDCLLSVSGDARACDASQVELVFAVMHRIASLELVNAPRASAVNHLADQLLGKRLDAPHLVLYSEAYEAEGWASGRPEWDTIEGRSLFPLLNMPRLHQVYFSRLNDHNLDSLLAFEHLSQLTTLSFRATQSWKDVDDSYDVSKLAEVLRRAATSLSTLHICGNFHGSVRHSIDSDIVLPKLRDMELDTKEDCWLPLLPRLTTPGMLFRVDIHLGTEAALQHANLLTAATRAASMISAASHSSPPPAPQLQVFLSFMHVARYLEEIPEVWFVAFGGVDISEDKATQGPRNHCLAYSYSFHLDTKSALTFLSAMLADLRPQIEHLSIFRGEYWPPTILNEIAGLFTAVEDVLFGGFTLPHITSALAAHPALLPNLRTIRLVECSICNQCQPSRPGTFCGCGQAMAVFAALLMHRRALGVPVRRASFVRCWQTRLAEQEAALAAIVPEFSVVDPQV